MPGLSFPSVGQKAGPRLSVLLLSQQFLPGQPVYCLQGSMN